MSKNTDWHLEKWRKCTIFVPYKKPFIFALSMSQIHALTAGQEHYKQVMPPFEEFLPLTRPSDSEDHLRRLSIYMNSHHAATRRGKAEMQYFLLEKDDKQ